MPLPDKDVQIININDDDDDLDRFHPPELPEIKSATHHEHCEGYRLTIPDGKSPHLIYPFALHEKLAIPWDYKMCHGVLFLRSWSCTNISVDLQEADKPVCSQCLALGDDEKLRAIEAHFAKGVHENSTLAYQGFGGITDIIHHKDRQINALNLIHLNLERKLLG